MANTFELLALEMRGRAASKPERQSSDGTNKVAWLARDTSVVMMPWEQALVFEGVVWDVTVGSFSTPITGGGAGTILDQDQPELVIDVPAGVAIVPLRVHAACQLQLIAADSDEAEILLAVDRTAISSASATNGTVETPLNKRTDKIGGSRCTVVSAVTVNLTVAPTLSKELMHVVKVADVQGTAATALWNHLELLYEGTDYIVGPATVVLYWGGTAAVSGFAEVKFAEFDAAAY